MAFVALDRSLFHGFMAPFTGLMRPFLAKPGDLSSLLCFMAGGTTFFQLDSLMLCMGEADITILCGETDHVSGQGCSGSKHDDGDAEDEILHFCDLLEKMKCWSNYNSLFFVVKQEIPYI
jgi:hypothetical protein